MKTNYRPARIVLVLSMFGAAVCPVAAQLPPTNLGKFVHQPGDNQYTDAAQASRHGGGAPAVQRRVNQVNQAPPPVPVGYTPTPPPRRPDATLEPIAADEPITEPGFPPLPERLDIPVAGGGTSWMAPPSNAGGSSVSQPRSNVINPTYHQHYGQVPAGAYLQNQNSPGYYKVQTPSNTNVNKTGNTQAAASNADTQAAPPSPVTVSQSSTQDLSVPDDDFTYKRTSKGNGPGVGRTVSRVIRGPLNQLGGMSGVRF